MEDTDNLGPRKVCLNCLEKHLSQAYVLLSEYYDDPVEFEEHFSYARGHLAEAADECKKRYPFLAQVIRAHRLKIMDDNNYWIDFKPILRWTRRLRLLENGIEVPEAEIDEWMKKSVEPVAEYIFPPEKEEKKTKENKNGRSKTKKSKI